MGCRRAQEQDSRSRVRVVLACPSGMLCMWHCVISRARHVSVVWPLGPSRLAGCGSIGRGVVVKADICIILLCSRLLIFRMRIRFKVSLLHGHREIRTVECANLRSERPCDDVRAPPQIRSAALARAHATEHVHVPVASNHSTHAAHRPPTSPSSLASRL